MNSIIIKNMTKVNDLPCTHYTDHENIIYRLKHISLHNKNSIN